MYSLREIKFLTYHIYGNCDWQVWVDHSVGYTSYRPTGQNHQLRSYLLSNLSS
jgi:hypothetical protein